MSWRKMQTATREGWLGSQGARHFPTASLNTCVMMCKPNSTHRDGPEVNARQNNEEIRPCQTKHKGGEQCT